ncbi:MAG: hypothetical protein AAB787_01950 [Patescibacteria group bacterium]
MPPFWILLVLSAIFLLLGVLRLGLKSKGWILVVLGLVFFCLSSQKARDSETDRQGFQITALILTAMASVALGGKIGLHLKANKKAEEEKSASAA